MRWPDGIERWGEAKSVGDKVEERTLSSGDEEGDEEGEEEGEEGGEEGEEEGGEEEEGEEVKVYDVFNYGHPLHPNSINQLSQAMELTKDKFSRLRARPHEIILRVLRNIVKAHERKGNLKEAEMYKEHFDELLGSIKSKGL